MFSVIKETASMQTRDGTRLDADIYRPEATGTYPVLLMRQPYGRAIASTVVYAHPRWYAARGYIVAIQDVRGRGSSQGEFNLFGHEVEDGFDSVNWAADLPGSSGAVGMYGFSYQGMTQLYAAAAKPTALKVICPAMVAYNLYRDWAYENGAFCWQANLSWAVQLAAETARLRGDEAAFLELAAMAKNLPLTDAIPADPDRFRELAPDSFYRDWLQRPEGDPYWKMRSPQHLLADADLPMLHVGGWFDPYLRGTIALYEGMAARSQFPQQLVIGPWAHLPWGRRLGDVDYGPQAAKSIDRLQLRWFDRFLKLQGELDDRPISVFELGSHPWRSLSTLSPQQQLSYLLQSQGLAGILDGDGRLISQIPAAGSTSEDVLVHDPWRPAIALGGHASFPPGQRDRSALDCRSDILTYTSDPLEQDLHVLGTAIVELNCQADAPSFDLCAVLSEVRAGGETLNFTQGYARIEGHLNPVRIPLQATCMRLTRGNCLRLSVSAACYPAYPVNPGTGTPPQRARRIEARVITLVVRSGSEPPSRLLLGAISSY